MKRLWEKEDENEAEVFRHKYNIKVDPGDTALYFKANCAAWIGNKFVACGDFQSNRILISDQSEKNEHQKRVSAMVVNDGVSVRNPETGGIWSTGRILPVNDNSFIVQSYCGGRDSSRWSSQISLCEIMDMDNGQRVSTRIINIADGKAVDAVFCLRGRYFYQIDGTIKCGYINAAPVK